MLCAALLYGLQADDNEFVAVGVRGETAFARLISYAEDRFERHD